MVVIEEVLHEDGRAESEADYVEVIGFPWLRHIPVLIKMGQDYENMLSSFTLV